MTKVGCPQVQTGRRRPFVRHLGYRWSDIPEFDGSNPYMQIDKNQNKDDQVRMTTTVDGRKLIGSGHFVSHLDYSWSDKTHIQS